jgi:4-amino-4-deoxy-L-arabinose transferase-like glycosyltransferase
VCLWSGFRAVSDDDYSRVTIAARFAAAPAADPSGTSWLPLPFWLYGAPMALFGDSLETARAVALLLGIASAVLVWLAARLLGLPERAALLGALGAVVLPYGSWLSCATVPEAPTAALILFGVVSLSRDEAKLRTWGGLALGAACFCRYEAWAPAATFAVLSASEAFRRREKGLWLAAAAAVAPIALWLLHGLVRHGDPLFFVARVTQYRAALGREVVEASGALLQTPWALLRFEPELMAVLLVTLGLTFWRRRSPFGPTAWRTVVALTSLVLFLILADATGGAATHHPERSLLPVFWFSALLAAGLVTRLAREPQAWLLPALAMPAALLGSLLLRPAVETSFVDRREEEQVGSLLRRLGASQVALDCDDFGYFAIQAALGHDRSTALSDHDPRHAAAKSATTAEELAAKLAPLRARWLVTTRKRAALAAALGTQRATTARFAVFELPR